ncbi:telomerase inhibitor [Gnomoniopsis smithogilvyi]|uniref:Telomerase inhibitor n=1 Tax=Gnomoniopsis smithogilvyi TaxID=1191159 RepID=A0A9W9CYX0_9PEZI|nr:telomerase inhibitor [Gnomoniopsis smithogilvyi]
MLNQKKVPLKPLNDFRKSDNTSTEDSVRTMSPLRGRGSEPSWAPSKQFVSRDGVPPPSPAPVDLQSATWGPNAILWNRPKGADLIIRCRPHGGREAHWMVHRRILVDMSEWMERYMPPEAEDGSAVEWDLSNWDIGQLGAVLQYMYLENFQGGAYDPDNPLNIASLVTNTAHFLAGTACLCRPMMDQAVDQIDDTTDLIQDKLSLLRLANIDEFEICIRRALLLMYDEPDQWRIRALRIVMGKLMAVCFPLILQSQRWETYEKWWGMLRVRVVADHKWLYQAGMCPRNDIILSGFENLDVIWVRYRKEGWQPSDDLMFPTRKSEESYDFPVSAPATPVGGKRKSKAIPIVDPSSKVTSKPRILASESTDEVRNTIPGDASSPALVPSTPNVEDPFTVDYTTPAVPLFSNPKNPFANAIRRARFPHQSNSVFPPPVFIRPSLKTATSLPVFPQSTQIAPITLCHRAQPIPVLPWLPDGPFYFAETSTGEPASRSPSNTSYDAPQPAFGQPSATESVAPSATDGSSCSTASADLSVIGESSCGSAAASSIDSLDSPTCRMAELKMAFDMIDNELGDEQTTPRAPPGSLAFAHEKADGFKKDEATPHASMFGQKKTSGPIPGLANTPTAALVNRRKHENNRA